VEQTDSWADREDAKAAAESVEVVGAANVTWVDRPDDLEPTESI